MIDMAQEMTKPLPVQQFVPEQTIQCYLDSLLQDAAQELALAEQQTQELAPPAQLEAAPVVVPAEPEPELEQELQVEALVELSTDAEHVPPVLEQAAWREEPFEALLFDVGGLTLAVPLVSLGSIYPLEDEITPLFGQPDWFLGILPTQAGNLKVLDTARWVMPERYDPALRDGLRFVISVQGYDWGMAVHGVSKSIRLTPEQVKWRSQQGKRPWLAGTVIEHMCALLDVSALATLISAPGTRALANSR